MAFAHDDRDLLVHFDVIEPESGELCSAHASLEEEPDARRVAAVVEFGTGAGVNDRLSSLSQRIAGGSSGTIGGVIRSIRDTEISSSRRAHLKNGWRLR